GVTRDTVTQRRAAYVGSVGAAFVVRDLMQDVFDESTLQRLRIRLYDAGFARGYVAQAGAADEQRLLYESRGPAVPSGANGSNGLFRTMLPAEFAGRIW